MTKWFQRTFTVLEDSECEVEKMAKEYHETNHPLVLSNEVTNLAALQSNSSDDLTEDYETADL